VKRRPSPPQVTGRRPDRSHYCQLYSYDTNPYLHSSRWTVSVGCICWNTPLTLRNSPAPVAAILPVSNRSTTGHLDARVSQRVWSHLVSTMEESQRSVGVELRRRCAVWRWIHGAAGLRRDGSNPATKGMRWAWCSPKEVLRLRCRILLFRDLEYHEHSVSEHRTKDLMWFQLFFGCNSV